MTNTRVAIWLVGALAFASCGATGNRGVADGRGPAPRTSASEPESGPPSRAADAAEPEDSAVSRPAPSALNIARVAGRDVPASELLELWLFRESPKVRAYLEELVLSRLVLAESHRLEIQLDPALLEERVEAASRALERRVEDTEPGLAVDDFIRQRLGLDPERYRARLVREVEIDLLAERCVRAWLLESERANVRVIVMEDRAKVDEVLAKLEAGEDFSALAGAYSIEESAGDGGRVPPVVRSNVALSRLAFTTPLGQYGGPVFEGGRYLFLQVDERPAPMEGGWSAIGEAVEASLDGREIEDPEYWQWKTAMLDRYSVDMSAFLDVVGEPAGR